MAESTTRNKNSYPNWLFYLLIAVTIIAGYSTYQFSDSATALKEVLKKTNDSLSQERNSLSDINAAFKKQSQLVIKNSGTLAFTIDKFYVFYFDAKKKQFRMCEGGLDGEIGPGGECHPRVIEGSNEVWNGEVIAYHIEVVSIKNYYKNNIRFCQNGTMDEGSKISINADFSKNLADDHRATCN